MIKFGRYLLSLFRQCFRSQSHLSSVESSLDSDSEEEQSSEQSVPSIHYIKKEQQQAKKSHIVPRSTTANMNTEDMRRRKVSAPTWALWRDAFQMFDKDLDGRITSHEIKLMLEKFDCFPTCDEVEDIIRDIDANHDGSIEAIEFVTMMEHRYRDQPFCPDDEKEDFKAAFDLFDKDKDGYISVPEMQTVLTTLGETSSEKELTDILAKSGINDTNKIQFDDFYMVLKRKVSREESPFVNKSSS